MNRLLTVSIALAACFFASCAGTKSKSKSAYSTTYEPKVTTPTSSSAVKVKVSTTAQRVYVMEGDKVLLASPCSVGTAADPTPHGSFRISTKKFDRRRQSSPGAGYPMTYWMSFASAAYGMHWGFVKPYPCTHGCVRLPIKTAKAMFALVSVGTPVIVSRSHPEDATIGATMPLLDDTYMPDPPNSYLLSPQVFADAQQGKLYHF